MADAAKDQSYFAVARRGSRGRFGSRWQADVKVLGCEDAKWIEAA